MRLLNYNKWAVKDSQPNMQGYYLPCIEISAIVIDLKVTENESRDKLDIEKSPIGPTICFKQRLKNSVK